MGKQEAVKALIVKSVCGILQDKNALVQTRP